MNKYDIHAAIAPSGLTSVTQPTGASGFPSFWSLDWTAGTNSETSFPSSTAIVTKQIKVKWQLAATNFEMLATPVALSSDKKHLTIAVWRSANMGINPLDITVTIWDGGTQIGDGNTAVTLYPVTVIELILIITAGGARRTQRIA